MNTQTILLHSESPISAVKKVSEWLWENTDAEIVTIVTAEGQIGKWVTTITFRF